MNKIQVEFDEETQKEKRLITTDFYSSAEVDKLIDAFYTKYNISKCDCLPYDPKPIKLILIGKEIIDPNQ